ncbi:hypothetical protein OG21DRAFT_1584072, partial [Imleria badia]
MNTATPSDSINGRHKRATIPLARLRDAENAATQELRSHQATKSGGGSVAHKPPSDSDSHCPSPSLTTLASSPGAQKRKRANSIHLNSDDEAAPPSEQSKGKHVATSVDNDGISLAGQSEAVASNGLLADIQVMDIDDPQK